MNMIIIQLIKILSILCSSVLPIFITDEYEHFNSFEIFSFCFTTKLRTQSLFCADIFSILHQLCPSFLLSIHQSLPSSSVNNSIRLHSLIWPDKIKFIDLLTVINKERKMCLFNLVNFSEY